MTQLFAVDKPGHFAIDWVTELLQKAGLQVSPTFSLQSALGDGSSCTCSQHASACDCNMEVLLVYGPDPLPATLVAHSHGDCTWLSLATHPTETSTLALNLQIKSILNAAQKNGETAR